MTLTGFFYMTQRVLPQLLSQASGHIVNVSASIVDHARSSAPSGLAALTKGGLDAVTRSLAIEFAAAGELAQRRVRRRPKLAGAHHHADGTTQPGRNHGAHKDEASDSNGLGSR